jgi:hypothetical protein
LLKPEYNILKVANSRLGHKLSERTKKAVSIALRGKKYKIKNDTIEKLSTKRKIYTKSRSISIKVFDNSNNKLFEFPTIKSAAEHFEISESTITRILKTGISYDNYIYKFEIPDFRI